jgi:hypothetical protein
MDEYEDVFGLEIVAAGKVDGEYRNIDVAGTE